MIVKRGNRQEVLDLTKIDLIFLNLDDELLQAEEKLEESKRITEQAMFNVLSNDVEQVSQLKALIDAQIDFHQQTLHVLENLRGQLNNRIKDCTNRPRRDHFVKPVLSDRTPRDR